MWQVFFPSQTLHVFFFLSQNLQIFGLALRKKAQYVVVLKQRNCGDLKAHSQLSALKGVEGHAEAPGWD
jgi:hypothetical protein